MGKGVDLVTREEAKFGKVSWPILRRLFIYFFPFLESSEESSLDTFGRITKV